MQAERVIHTPDNSFSELQAQIQEPLTSWVANATAIADWHNSIFAENGPLETYLDQVRSVAVSIQKSRRTGISNPINNLMAAIREESLYILLNGKLSSESVENKAQHHGHHVPNAASGAVEEHAQTLLAYANKIEPVKSKQRELTSTLNAALSQTLTDNPFLVLDLPGFLRGQSEFSTSLATYLAADHRLGLITAALQNLTAAELQSPSARLLNAFLAHAAYKHYTGNKLDPMWEMVALSFPTDNIDPKAVFTDPQADETTKATLLAPFIGKIAGNQLPHLMQQRYSLFLSDLRTKTMEEIRIAITPHKITFINPLVEKQRASRASGLRRHPPVKPPITSNKVGKTGDESPEQAKPKVKKVIIGSEVVTEDQIKDTLQKFLANKDVHVYTAADLDDYTLIVTKLAGIITNAPNLDLSKMHGANAFIDPKNTRIPLSTLRITSRRAPIFIVAITPDSIVVIDAFTHNNHAYHYKYENKTTVVRIPTVTR